MLNAKCLIIFSNDEFLNLNKLFYDEKLTRACEQNEVNQVQLDKIYIIRNQY